MPKTHVIGDAERQVRIPTLRSVTLAALCTVWLLLVGLGLRSLVVYETEPGSQALAPAAWPLASSLKVAPGQSALVMFVHPKCSCSRASLAELAVIMTSAGRHATAQVVFLRSGSTDAELERSAAWQLAGSIPSTTRVVDRDGREALRFGAQTSGQLVMYDSKGRLRFAGGITGSRGHAGSNLGRQTMLDLLTVGSAEFDGHAVFGCPMLSATPRLGTL